MSERPPPTEHRFRYREALRDNADAARIDRLWLRLRASRRGRRTARGTGWLVAAAVVLGFVLGAGVWPRRPATLSSLAVHRTPGDVLSTHGAHGGRTHKQLPAVLAAGTVARIVALPGGGWARLEPETIVAAEPATNGTPELHLLVGEVTLLAEPGAGDTAPRLRVGAATALQLHGRLRARRRGEDADLQLLAGSARLRRARPAGSGTRATTHEMGQRKIGRREIGHNETGQHGMGRHETSQGALSQSEAGSHNAIADEPLIAGQLVSLNTMTAQHPSGTEPLARTTQRGADTTGIEPPKPSGPAETSWRHACAEHDYLSAIKQYQAQPAKSGPAKSEPAKDGQLTPAELACLASGHKAAGDPASAAQLNLRIIDIYRGSQQAIAAARWLASYYKNIGQSQRARQYRALFVQLSKRHREPPSR